MPFACSYCAIPHALSYTGIQHVAGTPGDFEVSHVVKQQWEKSLGLPVTGRKQHVYDAGSKQSKRALLSKSDGGVRVWTDTYYVLLKSVSTPYFGIVLSIYVLTTACILPYNSHPTPFRESKTAISLHDAEGNLIHQAKLKEDALDLDPTSKEGSENAPPFHGYSKAGTAQGQLVYAHVSGPC